MLEFAGTPDLARRIGFDARLLDDPDAMIPLPLLHTLLEELVEASGDDYFGAHFAASVDTPKAKRIVGALGLMLLSSPNVAVGLESVVRHQRRFNEGDRYSLVEHGEDTHVCFDAWGPTRPGQSQMAEKTVVQILHILDLAEPAISPRAIRFGHSKRAGSEALTRALGMEPSFDADVTAVIVRSEDLQRPIRGADPDLFRFFDRHLASRPADELDGFEDSAKIETAEASTRAAVSDALHRGDYSSGAIASQLGLALRTLQRRLANEGTALKTIVDDVRRARACNLLRAGVSVTEVAILLGYSDTPPFIRAFKRWFDTSPAAWRNEERTHG